MRRMARGEVLFAPGDVPNGAWAIRRGLVELSVGAGRGRGIVDIAKRGELVGLSYALLDRPADVTARTVTSVEALFLAMDVRRLLETTPSLARLLLQEMSRQVLETRARIRQLLGRTLSERIARLLMGEAEGRRLTVSQSAIAQMLGVQRSSVNRVLRSFEEQGWLRLSYASVEILDSGALEAMADPGHRVVPIERPWEPPRSTRRSEEGGATSEQPR
ncbi:MAG TPA: Crp/Fnr family transcriptional regulator [Actinomycetota bacterium]|nr:Crp/Fnr family transcriptional regulator [Actinomycetota bacterium]